MRSATEIPRHIIALAACFSICCPIALGNGLSAWKVDFDSGKKSYERDDYPTAIKQLQTAASKCKAESTERAACLELLGRVYEDFGQGQRAEGLFKQSLEINQRRLGPHSLKLASVLTNLATVYRDSGREKEAEQLYKRALTILSGKSKDPLFATALENLGVLWSNQKRFEQSGAALRLALYGREREFGANALEVSESLSDLASDYEQQSRFSEAEPLLKRALAIREKKLGPKHSQTASILLDIANIYDSQSRLPEAEVLAKRALKIYTERFGPENHGVADALGTLASIYESEGHFKEAQSLYERALKIRKKTCGENSLDVADELADLGNLYLDESRSSEAETALKRSLEIKKHILGPEHPDVAACLYHLADAYQTESRLAESEALVEQSLKIYQKVLAPDDLRIAQCQAMMASEYQQQARYVESEELLNSALETYTARLGATDVGVASVLTTLGLVYQHENRLAEAESTLKHALELRERKLGPDHPDLEDNLDELGTLMKTQHRYQECESFYKRALKIREKNLGADNPDLEGALWRLSSLYSVQQRYLEAERVAWRSFEIQRKAGIDPLASEEFILRALTLGRELSKSSSREHSALITSSKTSAQNSMPSLQAPTLLENIKSSEATYGLNSPQVGECKLQLALQLAGYDCPLGQLPTNTLVALAPYAKYLLSDEQAANSTQSNNELIANRKMIERQGGRESALREVSTQLLCLAYLLAASNDSDQANHSARISVDCLKHAMTEKSTAKDLRSLLSLSEYFETEGQYANCKDVLSLAETRSRALKENELVSKALVFLAQVNLAEGDYVSCEATARNALGEIEKQNHTSAEYSQTLEILADCTEALGRVDDAIKYASMVLAARDPSGISTRSDLLPPLLTLGELYITKKDYASASREIERALPIAEHLNQAAERPIETAVFSARGDLALSRNDLKDARLWYTKACDIDGESEGLSLGYAHDHNCLAVVDMREGNNFSALQNALLSSFTMSKYLNSSFGQLSFAEQCASIDKFHDQTDTLVSSFKAMVDFSVAYQEIMKRKGLLIESLRRRTVLQKLATSNPEIKQLLDEQSAKQQQLKILREKSITDTDQANRPKTNSSTLTLELESLDRQISQKAQGVEVGDPLANKKTKDIQDLLADNEAFVDVIEYNDALTNKDCYAAVILLRTGATRLVDLKDAAPIDNAISEWRELTATSGGKERSIGASTPTSQATNSDAAMTSEAALQNLKLLLWNPINYALPESVQKIWLCPDGDAATIPWDILSDSDAELCIVDSPRIFVSLKEKKEDTDSSPNLLLAAGITFGDTALNLPGTKVEFDSIKEVAEKDKVMVQPFTGTAATEQAIAAALPTCTYAHFATHGFYSGPATIEQNNVTEVGTRSLRRMRQACGDSAYLIDARNPLLSSGLLLSGATLRGEAAAEGKFTADDIAGLDLHKCNLVTLSACESGLGRKKSGQGMIGLRSAILGAGARSILMSLWKVDDAATCKLMTDFYTNLFARHKPPIEALRLAQETVRKTPGWEHPYYWSGWILAGDGWQ
ncbi:MAG TPA: CHAT domain-containing tetratricopeptide repeat protein [Planktothrix sp.]|jgi:CHAT domain-containing protein/Tfp pilus assembly protein PilF